MSLIRAISLKNSSEAARMEALLVELEIPYAIRALHDSAYDGLYAATGGYGYVEVEENDAAAVRELYKNLPHSPEPIVKGDKAAPLRIPREFFTVIGVVAIIALSITCFWLLIENRGLKSALDGASKTENYYGVWNEDGSISYQYRSDANTNTATLDNADKNNTTGNSGLSK